MKIGIINYLGESPKSVIYDSLGCANRLLRDKGNLVDFVREIINFQPPRKVRRFVEESGLELGSLSVGIKEDPAKKGYEVSATYWSSEGKLLGEENHYYTFS